MLSFKSLQNVIWSGRLAYSTTQDVDADSSIQTLSPSIGSDRIVLWNWICVLKVAHLASQGIGAIHSVSSLNYNLHRATPILKGQECSSCTNCISLRVYLLCQTWLVTAASYFATVQELRTNIRIKYSAFERDCKHSVRYLS